MFELSGNANSAGTPFKNRLAARRGNLLPKLTLNMAPVTLAHRQITPSFLEGKKESKSEKGHRAKYLPTTPEKLSKLNKLSTTTLRKELRL
ncbi:MAG: hypothetical protein ACI9BD_000380 [Candidatus Marinamargulisbacteria bacterium]|jgi:hypothetical protein